MDIIVHVPAKETEHFWEEHTEPFEFWKLPHKPTKLEVGDTIWFSLANTIEAKATVSSIETTSTSCTTTDRTWSGCLIFWKSEEFQRVDPFAGPKLTRGFRYKRDYYD